MLNKKVKGCLFFSWAGYFMLHPPEIWHDEEVQAPYPVILCSKVNVTVSCNFLMQFLGFVGYFLRELAIHIFGQSFFPADRTATFSCSQFISQYVRTNLQVQLPFRACLLLESVKQLSGPLSLLLQPGLLSSVMCLGIIFIPSQPVFLFSQIYFQNQYSFPLKYLSMCLSVTHCPDYYAL